MKRNIIFVLLVILTSPLFCENSTSRAKISKKDDNSNIYYFNGFNFTNYNPTSTTSLTDIVNDEIEYINNDNSSKKKYAIVGHSQGGLRVLAYSKMLEEKALKNSKYKESADNLSAVVTVSGIDQGLKALSGGFDTVNKKLDDDVSIIYDGVNATLHSTRTTSMITDIVRLGSWISCKVGNSTVDLTSKKSIKFFLVDMMGDEYSSYIKPALEGASENSMPEIRDMIPKSNFIHENVDETITEVKKIRDPSKDKTSLTIKYKTVKILGVKINIPYITTTTTEGYSYVTEYSSKTRISNNVPFMYIVGLDNNTLKLVEQQSKGEVTEKDVRNFANIMQNAMEVGKVINEAENKLIIGLLTGGKNRVSKCNSAKKWFSNLDGEINELLGSSEHDGLVAKESQFYPKKWHTNIIDPTGMGFVPEYNENHASIDPRSNDKVRNEIMNYIDSELK